MQNFDDTHVAQDIENELTTMGESEMLQVSSCLLRRPMVSQLSSLSQMRVIISIQWSVAHSACHLHL